MSRENFETWASDNGKWPGAILRKKDGTYVLMQTQLYWQAWQAAMAIEPAKAVPLECEPDSFNALQRDVSRYRFFRDQNLWTHVSGGDIWDAIAEADPIELDAIIDSMMNLAGNANAQPVAPPAIDDETSK